MTISTTVANPSEDTVPSFNPVEYRYDVKLEVGAKQGEGPVSIVAIFHDLVKRMREVVDADKR